MYLKPILAAAAVALATGANAATTPVVFANDLDDIAVVPLVVSQPIVADLLPGSGFTDRFFDGSVDYLVTVSFELTGNPSVVDDVSFGVGTAKDDYSLAGGPVAGMPFSFLQSFTVLAGGELFVNFALNNIKGGGYEYSVTATPTAPVPVPAALPLLASGLAALGFAARRRSRKA